MSDSGEPAGLNAVHNDSVVVLGEEEHLVNYRKDKIRIHPHKRSTNHKVWLWKGNERRYIPAKDSRIPNEGELFAETDEPDGDVSTSCEQFLVIGVILAKDPDQLIPKETAGGRAGPGPTILDAGEHDLLRAVIPVTPRIVSSPKLEVACSPSGGRCFVKSIKIVQVFYYPEFMAQLSTEEMKTATSTKKGIGAIVARAAAVNPEPVNHAIPVLETWAKTMTANRLAQPKNENMAQHLAMTLSLLNRDPDVKHVKSLIATLKNAAPDLNFGPMRSDEACLQFFDETSASEYTAKQADTLSELLRDKAPDIQPATIIEVRKILCRQGKLQQITEADLSFFMQECAQKSALDDTQIEAALKSTTNHKRHRPPVIAQESDNEFSAADTHQVLGIIKTAVSDLKQYIIGVANGLPEQHGAVLQYKSMEDLMDVLKNAVDSNTTASLHTQIAAVHAAQMCGGLETLKERLRVLEEWIDEVLAGKD